MRNDFDPERKRLPIKIDGTSNGEFEPYKLNKLENIAKEEPTKIGTQNSKKLWIGRRAFLKSTCGAASTLLAFKKVFSVFAQRGGFFDIPDAAAIESDLANDILNGKELIVDMQTRCVVILYVRLRDTAH